MKNDCGAPAFDNVDAILADKIVAHSIRHSDEKPSVICTMTPRSLPLTALGAVFIIAAAAAVTILLAPVVLRAIRPSSE